jgi:peptide/nickel transport system permease protein
VSTQIAIQPGTTSASASRQRWLRARTLVQTFGMAVVTLFLISVIAFLAMNRSGHTIALNALGKGATAKQLQVYVAEHGLDRNVLVRYFDWLGHYLRGDWGSTLSANLPVKSLVLPAFTHTSELALVALIWSVPVGILLGVFMARRGGGVDASLLVLLTVVAALPEFVIGLIVLIFLAVELHWFPVDSGAISQGFGGDWIKAFIMPAVTLGLGVVPYVSRITRASVSEALSAPYTRNAVLRGLPRRRVVWTHATRTASVPLVNAIALNIIYIMGGVIVVENVFAFPGLGRLLVQSVQQSDANAAMAIIVLLGAEFIIIGLLADVSVTYLNPRLRSVR